MASLDYNLTRLSDARDAIANKIVEKGGTVGSNDGFEDFPDDIDSIQSGGGHNPATLGGVHCKPVSNKNKLDYRCWVSINWGFQGYGKYIWTDGENIYCSGYNSTSYYYYILNKTTYTWSKKEDWTGLSNWTGDFIWTDGENIYYSLGSTQKVLDISTSTWSNKTWNGLTSYRGSSVWTDGTNIYYSYNGDQYVLDKTTSTWTTKTWTGLTSFSGQYIWTDGDNIYYSNGSSTQYVLDKSTSTWSSKTWNGYTSFDGDYIWTDGDNIYYSKNSNQYVLEKTTSTWNAVTWSISSISGINVWTDGDSIYFSASGSSQYQLKILTSQPQTTTTTFPLIT